MTINVILKNVSLPGHPNTVSGEAVFLPERFYSWEDGSEPAEIIQADIRDDVTREPVGVLAEDAYRALEEAAATASLVHLNPAPPEEDLPF